jgi:DNA repair protein RecO (recombination protein O)
VHLEAPAIVCALLPSGETGAVVRFLTEEHGLVAGFVHGGQSRKQRPVLQPGNLVALTLRGRSESQLATAGVELMRARAALATSAAALATLDWLTVLTATSLSESVPHPALFRTLDAIIEAIAAGADTLALGEAVVRHELLMLGELGFGLDLTSCAATGTTVDLGYVSPKSSQAVCRAAGLPYAARLLPLPAFLVSDAPANRDAILDGLTLTRHFIERHLVSGRRDIFGPRERLANRVAAR